MGHSFNRCGQYLEILLDFSGGHLLRGTVCFFMRIIKVSVLRSARRVHLAALVAHGDTVAENNHREHTDCQPDVFGIIKKKSIPKGGKRIKRYGNRFLKYQPRNGLRSQSDGINDQRRKNDD